MIMAVRNFFGSSWVQLNIIGILLLAVAGFSIWSMTRSLTWWDAVPLALVSYAACRITFELTLNRANVPTIATGFIARRKMAAIVNQAVAASGKNPYRITDMGSGRGELSRYLAGAVKNSYVTGVEIAPIPHAQAVFVQRWFGPKNLSYHCLDFDSYSCAESDAVVMYLSGRLTQVVGEKLQRELRTGSIVISHTFPLGGTWQPSETITFRTPFKEKIFVYRKN